MSIEAIKVLRGCGASGKSLAAGTVYAVPGEVSDADARLLVQLGKVEPVAGVPVADVAGVPAAAPDLFPARTKKRRAE